MVTVHEVRACAMSLPRTEEHLIHDHVKFRVGKIVYASVSPDETIVGFGFPREERAALIAAEPAKFCLPRLSDQRFHWVHARMAAVGVAEMRELITDAWRMVVPKRLAAAHLGHAIGPATRHRDLAMGLTATHQDHAMGPGPAAVSRPEPPRAP
jgi:hypothetical protein